MDADGLVHPSCYNRFIDLLQTRGNNARIYFILVPYHKHLSIQLSSAGTLGAVGDVLLCGAV